MAIASVTRPEIENRPIARAVYALASARFRGTLRAESGKQNVTLTWADGAIADARSTASADDVGRALASAGWATHEEIATARARADARDGDLLAALAELRELSADQERALRRKIVAQRAAHLFALTAPDLEIRAAREGGEGALPPGGGLDARWLIARGVLHYYSEAKLARELSPIRSAKVSLADGARANLEALRLQREDAAVLDLLRTAPRTLQELASRAGLDRRRALATTYILLATDCIEVSEAESPSEAPAQTGSSTSAETRRAPGPDRAQDEGRSAPRESAPPEVPRGAEAAGDSAPRRGPSGERAEQIRRLIAEKREQLEAGADAFALLGISRTAETAEVNRAYFALAKSLHPDKLQAVGLPKSEESHRVFAALNDAFSKLADPSSRARYERELARGASEDAAEKAAAIMQAERHARRGEAALENGHFDLASRELEKAVELNPDEGEHHALAAWAEWCVAPDKAVARPRIERRLEHAAALSPNNPAPHYYRGHIAKQTGAKSAAIAAFERVLKMRPKHREAARELGLLREESERAARPSAGGLLSKLRRS